MVSQKVVVIGLDGATWDLLRPWATSGELPNIKRLMDNGVYADLLSTTPPVTLPAWTSMITGVNPGKHGIYDLFLSSEKGNKLISSRDRKVKTLFELLSDNDMTSVAVSIPGTFPPDKIKGAMVSGKLTTPGKDSNFIYPESMRERIAEFFDITFDLNMKVLKYLSATDKGELLKVADELAESELNAALTLWDIYEPSLLWHVSQSTDMLQHYLYDSKDPGSENVAYLLAHYRKVDSLIKGVIDHCGEDTTVLIVSDHGFSPLNKYLHLNDWLEQRQLLQRQREGQPLFWTFARFAERVLTISKHNRFTNRIALKVLRSDAVSRWTVELIRPVSSIDFSRTKAYCPTNTGHGIRLLNIGDDERNRLREEIISGLSEIRDPETDEPVVAGAYKTEDIYSGSCVSQAMDLLVETNEGYIATSRFSTSGGYLCPPPSSTGVVVAEHRPVGVFIASGSGIKAQGAIEPLRIYDVTPLILKVLGVAIPDYMDGIPDDDVLA